MELAICDFAQLLSGEEGKPSQWQTYLLCSDIAAGIDAIHEENVVHGDLKPQNILIFQEPLGLVAKLADFGLSIDSVERLKSAEGEIAAGTRLGGTPGWRAPEVERGEFLTPTGLKRADKYTFGLTVWAALFGSGKTPPRPGPNGENAPCESAEWQQGEILELGLDPTILNFSRLALPALLNPDPPKRPNRLRVLFTATGRRGIIPEPTQRYYYAFILQLLSAN
jgi:serine/threonine protein kinase